MKITDCLNYMNTLFVVMNIFKYATHNSGTMVIAVNLSVIILIIPQDLFTLERSL